MTKLKKEDEEDIIFLFKEDLEPEDLADFFDTSVDVISDVLEKYGYHIDVDSSKRQRPPCPPDIQYSDLDPLEL